MSDAAFEAITRARNQSQSGNPNGAVDTLEGYLATDPHNTKPRLVLAEIAVYSLKDIDYGMMQLDIILDLEPDNVDAMKAKATVLSMHKRNNKEAKELFERIIELSPDAETYNAYAKFLRYQITDFKSSKEYYEKAISLDPDNENYHINYAALLLNDICDYETAKKELELLMEMRPADQKIRANYDKLMKKKFDKNGNLKVPLKDRLKKG